MTDTRHAPLTTTHGLPVTARSVDVLDPSTGEVRSDSADGIACWFVDSTTTWRVSLSGTILSSTALPAVNTAEGWRATVCAVEHGHPEHALI